MTTESCTTTSLMTTWNWRTMCQNFKNNNNEQLPVDLWEVNLSGAPEWTQQAWMEPCFAMNGLHFCFMLDGCLYFSISAYVAFKMNVVIRWCHECYTSLCHNVTQVVTWPITSYGGSPALCVPINRFICQEKLVWFQYWNWNNPPIDLIFGLL